MLDNHALTRDVIPSAKKAAKITLFKLLSSGLVPEGLTARLLGVLGIGYCKVTEPRERVFIPKFMNGCAGGFCVSIDFDNRRKDRAEVNRRATFEILALCEEFDIPATWAICGITAVKEREAFESILSSRVGNEIAVHTFDHVDFSSQSCTEELARSQILRTLELLPPRAGRATFVFPWNRMGHLELLREMGFIAYRGRDRKLAYPSKNNGLWDIHPLFYLSERNYTHSGVLRALLDLAMSSEALFHLWFHPWNLEVAGDVPRYINDTIRPLFEYADLKRRQGDLWVCTLGELANYCEARSKARVSYREVKGSMEIDVKCKIEDARFNSKQLLTLGVEMPGEATNVKASLDGVQVEEGALAIRKFGRGSRALYLNMLFDNPLKHVKLEFLRE